MCFTKLFLGLVCTNEGSRSRDICQKQVMKFPRRLSTTFLSLPHPNQTRRERHFRVWLDPKKKKTVPSCQRLEYPTIWTCPGYKFLCLEAQESTRRRKKENDNISPNQGVCPEYCAYPALHYISRLAKFISLKWVPGQRFFEAKSEKCRSRPKSQMTKLFLRICSPLSFSACEFLF